MFIHHLFLYSLNYFLALYLSEMESDFEIVKLGEPMEKHREKSIDIVVKSLREPSYGKRAIDIRN